MIVHYKHITMLIDARDSVIDAYQNDARYQRNDNNKKLLRVKAKLVINSLLFYNTFEIQSCQSTSFVLQKILLYNEFGIAFECIPIINDHNYRNLFMSTNI